MSTPTIDLDVRNYVSAIRAELEDLDDEARDDILEDLEQHLREVAAEGEGALADRLGPPEGYAAELRASAGLPMRGTKPRRLRARLDAIGTAVRGLPGVEAFIDFSRELLPGWWVLRGALLVVAIDIVFFRPNPAGWIYEFPPSFGGSRFVGLVGVAVWVWGSVVIGRNASRERRIRRADSALTVIVLALVFFSLSRLTTVAAAVPEAGTMEMPPYLAHPDGSPIMNICPYSSDGQPLADVMLFDQDGRPITNVTDDANGFPPRRIANVYPHEQQVADPQTGETKPFQCPTLRRIVPVTPAPSASAIPSASPAPTESPVP